MLSLKLASFYWFNGIPDHQIANVALAHNLPGYIFFIIFFITFIIMFNKTLWDTLWYLVISKADLILITYSDCYLFL